MIENYEFVDLESEEIVGWSHGGLIALMAVVKHPKDYRIYLAGGPVSDLIARMGYKNESYRQLYSADYHLDQTTEENMAEYKKRPPVWNVHNLQTHLLFHTSTNDEDLNYLEVEYLIKALKATGKQFEYEAFQNLPGGHSFD